MYAHFRHGGRLVQKDGSGREEILAQEMTDLRITLIPSEIESGAGFGTGYPVAEVDVDNCDGTYTRFFLTVKMNKRDQPVFEVASASAVDKVVSKRVTGFKRKRRVVEREPEE
jgi:hypothetical protein